MRAINDLHRGRNHLWFIVLTKLSSHINGHPMKSEASDLLAFISLSAFLIACALILP